ncbi:hypothetical protein TTHERM_000295119 (macronuclear) [Tetrahymena thermophila SB210]|uniref:GOLD domain-containing protein n=1 Tax=Tetrahymena thermophila (strain SB210) TaxID=312017 RepID=W7X6V6_TETTS|nr:hypothetical protein TTHERM_000295119 [Tetrahymena thermophila SB210]EWS75110.1 hypothetical protein TTHERM_000295119 [Tetrahymena thermophila SB210]|eukprot:XP_012652348.1 hypothetical protein TTHERM_000295119 [Tetrahymena thermophila SB210]
MFIFQKFVNKKSAPTNQKDINDSQESQENNKKQFSQKIQLPLRKALFPTFYSNQPTIQNIYQDGVKILQKLQEIIEQIQSNKLLCSQENVKKLWKEIDQVFQKLEGTQLSNQIKLIFYQYIYKTLNIQEQAIDFISDELKCYDKEKYSLIQFFIQWQQQYCKHYTEECTLSLNRGLNILKNFIDQIDSSFEICCFLNFYSQDILTPLGFQQNDMQQLHQKIKIENQIQEQTIVNILETVLFIYNLQLYLPSQLVKQNFPYLIYNKNLFQQKQSQQINSNKPDQLSKINEECDKNKLIQSTLKLTKDSYSDDKNSIQQISKEWDKQQNSIGDEQIHESYEDIQLNQSFDDAQSNIVQPISFVLWQEYEIIKRFTNYIDFIQLFIEKVIVFNQQDECTSNVSLKSSSRQSICQDQQNDILKAQILIKSYFYLQENQKIGLINLLNQVLDNLKTDLNFNKLKHLTQLILFFITSDEVESNHKKIIFSNKLSQELLIHFQKSEQKKILNHQNIIQSELISNYQPLLDFQQCVIKNGKTKKVHINSKSKININVDIFEKLSIVNLSIGILNKDIKLCIKYLGPLDTPEKINPIELIRTGKINQAPYRINFLAEQEGIYCIEFINSYSWFASKEIEYRINILTPFQVGLNQSSSLTKTIFPIASKPFHQKAVEHFQENQKIFNQATDQALLVLNQNMLTILYKTNNNQKFSNIIEIFKSNENQNIFETLEPQVISSLCSIINQIYQQDSKIYFNKNSKNKLVLYIIVDNEEQIEYFNRDSLFQLTVLHNFPVSEIIIESYPNIFIQMFLMQKGIIYKQKIILYWQYNNNLYKSNNYECAQLVENNFDEVYQISYDQISQNQVLIITKSNFEEINQSDQILRVKNELQQHNFILQINNLFQ